MPTTTTVIAGRNETPGQKCLALGNSLNATIMAADAVVECMLAGSNILLLTHDHVRADHKPPGTYYLVTMSQFQRTPTHPGSERFSNCHYQTSSTPTQSDSIVTGVHPSNYGALREPTLSFCESDSSKPYVLPNEGPSIPNSCSKKIRANVAELSGGLSTYGQLDLGKDDRGAFPVVMKDKLFEVDTP